MRLGCFTDDRVLIVFNAIDSLTGRLIIPVISGDSVLPSVATGIECGMAGRRSGSGMSIMCIDINDAIVHKAPKSRGSEPIFETRGKVAS